MKSQLIPRRANGRIHLLIRQLAFAAVLLPSVGLIHDLDSSIRSTMLAVTHPLFWRCDSCQTNIDTMNHVLWCPSYSELRSGKDLHDDQDVANYLHDVMLIRSKLDIQK